MNISCGKILWRYAARTDTDTVSHIAKASQLKLRYFYGVVAVGMIIAFVIDTIHLYAKYVLKETNPQHVIKHGNLPFPAVTVCNINPFKKSRIEQQLNSDIQRALQVYSYQTQKLRKNNMEQTTKRMKRQADLTCVDSTNTCWYTNNSACLTTAAKETTKNVTKNGRTCQMWNSDSPQVVGAAMSIYNDNYCRDPDKSGAPWCYTMDPTVRWEKCYQDISYCATSPNSKCAESKDTCWFTNSPTCLTTAAKETTKNVTMNGRACQMWSSDFPHVPYAGAPRPNDNYCRDPNSEGMPWCYTTNNTVRWEYCYKSIRNCVAQPVAPNPYPFLPSNLSCADSTNTCWLTNNITCLTTAAKETTKNVTMNGRACQMWSSDSPHVPYTNAPRLNDNYCRDPDSEGLPWCYTTNPAVRWEYCYKSISYCATTTSISTTITTTSTSTTVTATPTTSASTTTITTSITTTKTTTKTTSSISKSLSTTLASITSTTTVKTTSPQWTPITTSTTSPPNYKLNQAISNTDLDYDTLTPAQKNFFDMLTQQFDLDDAMEELTLNSLTKQLIQQLAAKNKTLAQELSYSLQDMLLSCVYHETPCDMQNDFKLIQDPFYGNCYSFNHHNHYNVSRTGPHHGLRMFVSTELTEYILTTDAQGIIVSIHDQTIYPFPDIIGFKAATGYSTSFGIKKNVARSVPPPAGKCVNQVDKSYVFPGNYQVEGCYRSCFQLAVINVCGCADSRFPLPNTTTTIKYCDPLDETQHTCMKNYSRKIGDYTATKICDCPDPCNSIYYTMSGSSAVWPTVDMTDCFLKHKDGNEDKSCKDLYRDHTLELEVYYHALEYEYFELTMAYPLRLFLYDVSNSLNFWLGISLLCAIEIVVLLAQLLTYCCCTTAVGTTVVEKAHLPRSATVPSIIAEVPEEYTRDSIVSAWTDVDVAEKEFPVVPFRRGTMRIYGGNMVSLTEMGPMVAISQRLEVWYPQHL